MLESYPHFLRSEPISFNLGRDKKDRSTEALNKVNLVLNELSSTNPAVAVSAQKQFTDHQKQTYLTRELQIGASLPTEQFGARANFLTTSDLPQALDVIAQISQQWIEDPTLGGLNINIRVGQLEGLAADQKGPGFEILTGSEQATMLFIKQFEKEWVLRGNKGPEASKQSPIGHIKAEVANFPSRLRNTLKMAKLGRFTLGAVALAQVVAGGINPAHLDAGHLSDAQRARDVAVKTTLPALEDQVATPSLEEDDGTEVFQTELGAIKTTREVAERLGLAPVTDQPAEELASTYFVQKAPKPVTEPLIIQVEPSAEESGPKSGDQLEGQIASTQSAYRGVEVPSGIKALFEPDAINQNTSEFVKDGCGLISVVATLNPYLRSIGVEELTLKEMSEILGKYVSPKDGTKGWYPGAGFVARNIPPALAESRVAPYVQAHFTRVTTAEQVAELVGLTGAGVFVSGFYDNNGVGLQKTQDVGNSRGGLSVRDLPGWEHAVTAWGEIDGKTLIADSVLAEKYRMTNEQFKLAMSFPGRAEAVYYEFSK